VRHHCFKWGYVLNPLFASCDGLRLEETRLESMVKSFAEKRAK
jgi:hypothetical protein